MGEECSFYDWLITASFYVAVHCVDALLADRGIHPRNHPFRNNQVGAMFGRTNWTVFNRYMKLYNRSRQARYEENDFCNKPYHYIQTHIDWALEDFMNLITS